MERLENLDVRWRQRFENYKNALATLERVEAFSKDHSLTEVEALGLIQSFEFTHELSWKVMKDYLEAQGFVDIHGSGDATRLAFANDLIDDGVTWMEMTKSRNRSSHTYEQEIAEDIKNAILEVYIDEFRKLRTTLERKL